MISPDETRFSVIDNIVRLIKKKLFSILGYQVCLKWDWSKQEMAKSTNNGGAKIAKMHHKH